MARRIRFTYDAAADLFARQAEDIYQPIAEAATAAIRRSAANIKARGRANIAAAGFGRNWMNTFRVETYPKGSKKSANAAALVFHAIDYADIFENGGTIRGRPLLWLPLRATPKKVSTYRLTPKRFVQEVGPLFSITGRRTPLLGARVAVTPAEAKASRITPTIQNLRAGAQLARSNNRRGAGVVLRTVPLFHGVRQVTIRKRFDLVDIIRSEVDRLPEYYSAALKGE